MLNNIENMLITVNEFGAVILNIVAVVCIILFVANGLKTIGLLLNFKKIKIPDIKGIRNGIIAVIAFPINKIRKDKGGLTKKIGMISLFLLFVSILFCSYYVSAEKYDSLISFKVIFSTSIVAFIVTLFFYGVLWVLYLFVDKVLGFIFEYIFSVETYLSKMGTISIIISLCIFLSNYFVIYTKSGNMNYFNLVAVLFCIIFTYIGLGLIINKPEYLSAKSYKFNKFSKYIGMIIWLTILLTDLYCGVLVVASIDNGAFVVDSGKFVYESSVIASENTNVTDPLSLLYYTLFSFFTIGFGDIKPGSVLGKISAIIIFISGIYYLVIFISSILSARISGKEELYGFVNRRVNLIVSNVNSVLSDIEKASNVNIPRNEIREDVIYTALSKINPASIPKKFPKNKTITLTWAQYLIASRDQCVQNINSIFTIINLLEPEFVRLLLEIESSDYYFAIDETRFEPVHEKNLSFLTKKIYAYVQLINKLEKYRVDNLDGY